MLRAIRWVMLSLVGLVAVAYIADSLLLQMRVRSGTAYEQVEVRQYLATALKGNKTEYDFTGTASERCSRSLFPQNGSSPCWWLKQHTRQWN